MTQIIWDDQWNVGIKKIDKQHKNLVDLINKLNDQIEKGKSHDVLSNIILELINYIFKHFSYEENLIEKHHYPDRAEHKIQHDKFVDKVNDFTVKFENKELLLSEQIAEYLQNWLINHIQKMDKLYSSYLIEKGVK